MELLLIIGLGGLWLGAQLTINGAMDIAERHKISHMFIGLTILALGTDLPELFIDVNAAIQKLQGTDTSGLIVGETIGTCLGQIALVLGIASLYGVFRITKRGLLRDGLTMLGSVVLLFALGLDGELSRADGAIMVLVYAGYFLTLFREEKLYEKLKRAPQMHLLWAIVSVIAGIGILVFASNMTIENALAVSEKWGVSQHIIGILVVGLGTSLPELATSITAVKRGAGKMAAGNLIGSNIFDMLFTLGIGSAIAGFSFRQDLLFIDLPILFVVSGVALLLFRRTMRFTGREGVLMVGVYLLYFVIRIGGVFVG